MVYRIFFMAGLLLLLLGQILLAQGNDFVYSQSPIDFAHWFLLVGAVCLIPQVVTFPPKFFSYVGIPLSLVGIACIIGMCVLDFIFWSFPNEEARLEFAKHVTSVPSIWEPFMSIGPSSKVFNVGLMALSLDHFKPAKVGVVLVVLATLVLLHLIPVPFRLVVGYTLTLAGFGIILLRKGRQA